MWPSAFSVFKSQPCPLADSCEIPNCLFSHHQSATSTAGPPPAKRVRLTHDAVPKIDQSLPTLTEAVDTPVFTGLRASKQHATHPNQETSTAIHPSPTPTGGSPDNAPLRTATRPISPTPKKAPVEKTSQPEEDVKLFPRSLQNNPMQLPQRLIRLKALHDAMVPFNDKTAKARNPSTKALHLTANQLRKLAVDEEANIAIGKGVMYDNVIKLRIVAYRKMTQEEWVAARREAVAKETGGPPKKPPPKKVETSMTLKQEVIFLSTMLASPKSLLDHGFVADRPSAAEVEECRQAQVVSDFWEVCDRCGTRFQVFPERREKDGALTTGGKCHYHWGKKIWPKRTKGQESDPAKYSCCNESIGSPGCTESDTHVYKFTDVKRMSLVMPFIETPENAKVEQHTAVCFDCEMGYTTQGFELLRLTVLSWPSHRPIIDVLVRPLGFVLDLNTQWSGVTMDQFLNAKPYDPSNPKPSRKDLRIVESPYVARELLLAHISPTTPVLGHALENDLNVVRLIHPTIVDTVILYPTRSGLPYRHSLKTLAKQHLDIDVQQGGASGHDSYEDARTTGELVRCHIARKWKRLRDEGWTIREDGVHPPLPIGLPPDIVPAAPSMIPLPKMVTADETRAMKRKLDDDGDDEKEGT